MTFAQQLSEHMARVGCNDKQLAESAGMAPSTISRYRTGRRTPGPNGDALPRLAAGLAALARQAGQPADEAAVLEALRNTVNDGLTVSQEAFRHNLQQLFDSCAINRNELAREMHYDPSYISRVLSGKRRPADLAAFCEKVARFAVEHSGDERRQAALADVTGLDPQTLADPARATAAVADWLGSNTSRAPRPLGNFLEKLDAFDLDEYVAAIHFNDMRIPTVPFHLPTRRQYTGLASMMESELDFLKATVLSKSREDVILYSDMPMEAMAKDPDFPKKWMFGMAAMLKKGLHLHLVHDVNRPFAEMMLGMESNLPMYMTGQIDPYYLPASQSRIFLHLLKVSGAAALAGEAVAGFHEKGRYTLTNNRDDLRYYRARARQLLDRALPLMQIYRSERQEAFWQWFWSTFDRDRQMVCGGLPLFTASEALLAEILAHNAITGPEAEAIAAFHRRLRAAVEGLLASHTLALEIPAPEQEELAAHPPTLAVAELFCTRDIAYTPAQYNAHLRQTRQFAEAYAGCTLTQNPAPAFRNISYAVISRRCVLVSKNKSPTIHFVIQHPKMVDAFVHFAPPVRESDR